MTTYVTGSSVMRRYLRSSNVKALVNRNKFQPKEATPIVSAVLDGVAVSDPSSDLAESKDYAAALTGEHCGSGESCTFNDWNLGPNFDNGWDRL